MLNDAREVFYKRFFHVTTILSFLLITFSIVSVYNSPMAGYEYSVYGSTPLVFWLAMAIGLLNGIGLLYRYYGKADRLWALGLVQIVLCNFLLLSLYVYKGFIYLERTDSLTYIGFARDTLIAGGFYSTNFYPIVSIMMAVDGQVLNVNMALMSQFLPAISYSMYTVFLLCWARSLSPDPRFVSSMMLASMPIFFAWFLPTLFHETICVLLLPMFFYSLSRGRTGGWKFVAITALMLVFFTLGHPLVAVSTVMFLAIIWLAETIMKREVRTTSFLMVVFGGLLISAWIASQAILMRDLNAIVEQMFGMLEGQSTFSNAQGMSSKLGLLSTLQSILVCVIDDIIYVLMALWVGLIILFTNWKGHPMTTVMACFLGGALFLAALIFLTFAHNPFRLINLNFVMIFTIPLAGYLLYRLRKKSKVFKGRLVAGGMVFCMVFTVFVVYQDPVEMFPNGSVTRSEIAGTGWFLEERGPEMRLYDIYTEPWRYADLMHGTSYNRENPEVKDNETYVTSHFASYLNLNVTREDAYLFLSTYDKVAYLQLWSSADRINQNDLVNLEVSNKVDHVYDNGCITCYRRA